MRTLTYREAISEATVQMMERDPSIVVMGIGVDDHKGLFGTTLEANSRFPERVFDIPNAENALTGVAIGLAVAGKRPLFVHARADFTFLAMDQLINLAAKWKYMYQSERGIPLVVRMIVGRGWGQGATHSQSLHSLYAHFPGLYVAAPSTPDAAGAVLRQALSGDTPTIIVEHRSLYERSDLVADFAWRAEPGDAWWADYGPVDVEDRVTIAAASYMAWEAERAADILGAQGVAAEIWDPVWLRPLDVSCLLDSVRSTGHLVIADTSWASYGFSAEIAAVVAEQGFKYLQAPIKRVTLADCPAPVSEPLERAFHPSPETIARACLEVLGRDPSVLQPAEPKTPAFVGPY